MRRRQKSELASLGFVTARAALGDQFATHGMLSPRLHKYHAPVRSPRDGLVSA
jgi:hypothetical protein